jgi:hypothetical protein
MLTVNTGYVIDLWDRGSETYWSVVVLRARFGPQSFSHPRKSMLQGQIPALYGNLF